MKQVFLIAGIIFLILGVEHLFMDTFYEKDYTDLKSQQCFSRHTPEPWDHAPYGKIEAVGVKYLLISTTNPGLNKWNDVWSWEVSKEQFVKTYKEVPCGKK